MGKRHGLAGEEGVRVIMIDETPKTIQQAGREVREKIGVRRLTDEDVLVLACEEIARSYSREEKGYT